MGRPNKTQAILNKLTKTPPTPKIPKNEFVLPNHSGDNSAGKILKTPVDDYDIANKKYVDDLTVDAPTKEDWDQNGFSSTIDNTLTFTDGTRTLSIAPTGDNFTYFMAGESYTSTGASLQIADTEGIHAIYFNGDSIAESVNPNAQQYDTLIKNRCLISTIYWDADNSTGNYVGDERHGKSMSPNTHAYLHNTKGLSYWNGLALNTISSNQDGSSNAHAQFGVDSGAVSDEDLYFSISAVTSTTGLPIYYLDGANGNIRKDTNAGYSVLSTGNVGEDRLAYNQLNGGSWSLTEVGEGDYVLCHVFATGEKDNKIVSFVGTSTYQNQQEATEGAFAEIKSLVLDYIDLPECRPLASVIFQTSDSYTNAVKARIVTTGLAEDYIDWTNQDLTKTSLSTTNHPDLSGLTWSDSGHTIDTDLDIDSNDLKKIATSYYGASNQSSIAQNGTDLIVTPQESGSAIFRYNTTQAVTTSTQIPDKNYVDAQIQSYRPEGRGVPEEAIIFNVDGDMFGDTDFKFDFSEQEVVLTGEMAVRLDNKKIKFGTGDDCYITYDGTDMIIKPDQVGSGDLKVDGVLNMNTHKIEGVVDPSAAQDAATKNYVDSNFVDLTNSETVAGVKTFSSFPVTPSSAPTTDYQVANKKYVDDNSSSYPPTLTCAFMARKNTDATGVGTSAAVVTFQTTEYDIGSDFNTSTNRFTAPTTGYYHFDAALQVNSLGNAKFGTISIYVNGSLYNQGSRTYQGSSGNPQFNLSTDIKLTSGDYVEIWFAHNDGTKTIEGNTAGRTWFCGHLLGV